MVKYARCNAILSLALDESGEGCRYMSKHLVSVHQVDATDLVWNIRATTKTTRK